MRRYLYIGVFFAGCASLAVEMSASRLLGNYFGSSNLVWAAIIGLILIYLSVGYTIGGKWADRSPEYKTFFSILCWASLLIGLIPLASRPILRTASQAFDDMRVGVLVGSFVSVLALFSLPVTLLGTASPFAVRIALQDKQHAGSLAGRIYTISTLGSFIGTFLPALLLIPALGTYKTFVVIGAVLMLSALFGLWQTSGARCALKMLWMPVLLVLATMIGLRGYDKQAEGIIYEGESAYNYIQVQQINDYRLLRLNEGQGIHSIYHPTKENFHGSWEQVLAAPFFYPAPVETDDIQDIAILGLAAGTSARQAYQVFPQAHIDGFEIDPEIVSVGYDLFEMDVPTLDVFVADARWGLNHSESDYDIISIDAYRPPYIPWHLTTREFFKDTYAHLSPGGTLVINVARILDDRRLVDTLYTTIKAVYPSVYIIDIPDTLNSIIYATRQPTQEDNLILNYIALSEEDDASSLLLASLETAILNFQPLPQESTLLTDDLAPVEWITNAHDNGYVHIQPARGIAMKILKRAASILGVILFPAFAVLTSIRIALTPFFINLEYRLPGFPPDTYGFTTADRLHWAQFSIDYLLGKINHADFSAQILPDGTPLFNPRELMHMLDVRNLTIPVLNIWLAICFFFFAMLLLYLLSNEIPKFLKPLKTGGLLTILLIIAILLGVLLNFNLLFSKFHQIFFEGDSWLFYASDNLIRLFPMRFWRDLFIFIGAIAVIISLLPQLISLKKKK